MSEEIRESEESIQTEKHGERERREVDMNRDG